jgi:hypothetical protein
MSLLTRQTEIILVSPGFHLYELAYSLVSESPDREPVKFGIAILGLYRKSSNEELFQTLGWHEEFTLFCAVALANSWKRQSKREPLRQAEGCRIGNRKGNHFTDA